MTEKERKLQKLLNDLDFLASELESVQEGMQMAMDRVAATQDNMDNIENRMAYVREQIEELSL